ncbi:MAG: ABC transporter ATP-binding protein [Rickettsiales bacterium]|nr:ABC transporter ATP-binding protein [Rickettsiales bacterium]
MEKENKKGKTKEFDYNSTRDVVIRILKECVLPNKGTFLVAVFFMLIASASTSYRAFLMKPAIDKVFIKRDLTALYVIPMQIILVAVVSCVSVYIQGLLMHSANSTISVNLRAKLFEKLIRKDINFYQKRSTGRVSGYFDDINGISEIINLLLTNLILQFFTVLFLLTLMFYQNFKLSVISFVAFPLVVLPIVTIGRKMRKLANESREKSLDNSAIIFESFENIKVVRINNKEQHEISRVNSILEEIHKISMKIAKKSLIISPMIEMVGTIGFALVILYGGMSVIRGISTAGEFFVFMTALFSAYKPLKSFSGLNIKLQHAIACARRYYIVIDQENFVKEAKHPIVLENVSGNIKFDNVSFRYPLNDFSSDSVVENEELVLHDKYALKDINLNMNSGKSYALVGHSGSGKSTIFNLLLRFYDVYSGGIYIDGVNIKDLSFKTLRKNISMVEQDVKLFNTTILENIRYAKSNATIEEVMEVAKMANVDEFVEDMPSKYDTIIGPNGSLLSGGQKQRISIARAFLKNSPILLLDEATSALDPISEELIQKSLHNLMKNRTTIIIAHRLTTIMNCDHIFVFENGELKEEGNHQELTELNGVYKNLCDKQFHSKV